VIVLVDQSDLVRRPTDIQPVHVHQIGQRRSVLMVQLRKDFSAELTEPAQSTFVFDIIGKINGLVDVRQPMEPNG
jgi:hypothetical protein